MYHMDQKELRMFANSPCRSIGFKSLNHCTKVGVKSQDLFLLTEWLKRNVGSRWRQKFSDRGAGASDRGAKMTEKWCFRALFCQISSDENPEFPPTDGGARCLRRGAVAPPSPPLAPPLVGSQSKLLPLDFQNFLKFF